MLKPSGCPGAGAAFENFNAQARGSIWVNSVGKNDTSNTSTMIAAEIQNIGRTRMSRQASSHKLDFFSAMCTASTAATGVSSNGATKCSGIGFLCSGIANPRVERGIQEIDDQVDAEVD